MLSPWESGPAIPFPPQDSVVRVNLSPSQPQRRRHCGPVSVSGFPLSQCSHHHVRSTSTHDTRQLADSTPTLRVHNMSEKCKTPMANFTSLWDQTCSAECASIKTGVKSHCQLSGGLAQEERELKTHMQLTVTVESMSYTNQSTPNHYKLDQEIFKRSTV